MTTATCSGIGITLGGVHFQDRHSSPRHAMHQAENRSLFGGVLSPCSPESAERVGPATAVETASQADKTRMHPFRFSPTSPMPANFVRRKQVSGTSPRPRFFNFTLRSHGAPGVWIQDPCPCSAVPCSSFALEKLRRGDPSLALLLVR